MFQSPRPLVAAAPLPAFGRAAALKPPRPPFRLVVDLTQAPFSRTWWRGAATLLALIAGVIQLAPTIEPLPAGIPEAAGADQARQEAALGLAPLGAGSRTGMTMGEGPLARPIASAPLRQSRSLDLVFAAGDDMVALLTRNGVSQSDAVRAASLVRAEGAVPPAGTTLSLRLGTPDAAGRRPLDELHFRARLDLELTILRAGDGLAASRKALAIDRTPLRIRGSAGGGLYWALRSAGASPQQAADYLQAIGDRLDVGSEVAATDRFELVIAQARTASGEANAGPLLYARLDRSGGAPISLVRWPVRGQLAWLDEATAPEPTRSGLLRPVDGPITSGFGSRMHPILHFLRMHKGIDFGAPMGAPIVAAADGQVIRAGWAGGYGRQIRIAHAGGLVTTYNHMSGMVASEGSVVHRGQLIGYVGSSGLSTGPHLHYEVLKDGVPVNPLGVTFVTRPIVDAGLMAALRARVRALRGV
ncbi:hypothetical protein GCM10022281_09370 [Sphingomonas rosea]|uniref:M23ase beta-sheet core domain-containing protein n=1 Tax=Sphingomonas rosea TaxID=335605 RepID=A0ABP7TW23_9SPHN